MIFKTSVLMANAFVSYSSCCSKNLFLLMLLSGEFFVRSYKKFKNCKFYGLYIFHRPVIVINDPNLIKAILVKDFNKFIDRGWYTNEETDPLSLELFLSRGQKWKRMRDKLSPTLTSGKLKQMYPILNEMGNKLFENCTKHLKTSEIIDVKNIIDR